MNVLQKGSRRAVHDGEKIGGKLGRTVATHGGNEQKNLYFVAHKIAITMKDLSRVVGGSEETV